jgi:hypothetical protein
LGRDTGLEIFFREKKTNKKILKKNAKKIAFCIDTKKNECYNFSMLKIQHFLHKIKWRAIQ